jgi:DNA-binding SARP family transcriptional activator
VATLRINLFGQIHCHLGESAFKLQAPPKAITLLAYLLLRRETPIERDGLAFTLWPDDDEDTARSNFRRHLYHLQHALPALAGGQLPWIIADGTSVHWNGASDYWLDVEQFERLSAAPTTVAQATDLYSADLLENVYDDWLFPIRERLRTLYISGLLDLVRQMRGKREFTKALEYAHRVLTQDPWREDVLRQLMALRFESGDRAGALQEYERFARRLREEMDVDPMPESAALRESIAANTPMHPPEPTAGSGELVDDGDSKRPVLPFVGRQSELEHLRTLWSRAARGKEVIAFIGGEAGIGKTRLIGELALVAESQGARVAWGNTSYPESSPYQAIASALNALLPLLAALDLEPVWLATLGQIVPDLRARRSDLPTPLQLNPEHEQQRLFEAVARALRGLAMPRPLLIILEDLHWAGTATIAMLEFLARRIENTPLLILATYRDEQVPREHPLNAVQRKLQQAKRAHHIGLRRLPLEAVETLLSQVGGAASTTPDLAFRLHSMSEGNPLFLLQILRDFLESGAPLGDQLPTGIESTIATRVARLSEEAQALGGIAAAVGTAFDVQLVREVSGWDHKRVLSAIDELLDRHLIREGAGRNAFDFAFSHHLIQSSIYAAMPVDMRKRRHRRIAHVMEQLYQDRLDDLAAQLALHLDRGDEPEKAIDYYARAGAKAFALYANEEALSYATRALALEPRPAQRADLLLLCELIHARLGDRGAQQRDIQELNQLPEGNNRDELRAEIIYRSILLSRQVGDRSAEARLIERFTALATTSADPRRLAQSEQAQGVHALLTGAYDAARQYLESALHAYEDLSDSSGQVECWINLSEIAHHRENVDELNELLTRARQSARTERDPLLAAKLLEISTHLAHISGAHGQHLATAQRWLALTVEMGDRRGEAGAHRAVATAASEAMQVELARVHYRLAADLSKQVGDPEGEASVLHDEAVLLFKLCRYDEAIANVRRAQEIFRQIGHVRGQAYCALNIAGMASTAGRFDEGRDAAVQALELAHALKSDSVEAAALENLGISEAGLGHVQVGVNHLARAIELARPLNQPAALANYLAEYAYSLLQAGQVDDAARHIDEALEIYATEGDNILNAHSVLWRASAICRARGDQKKSRDLLVKSYDTMQRFLTGIPDQESRAAFLNDPANCRIVAAHERDEWPPYAAPPAQTGKPRRRSAKSSA